MTSPRPDDDLRAADLVGTWSLLRWESLGDDGTVVYPFGPDPHGYIVYTSDGHMITTISEAQRAPIGGDLLAGPAEARLAAFASFVAYSGRYRVADGDVIHVVELSLFPDWIGVEQRRHVELDAARTHLTLSTDPMPTAGRMGRQRLTWQRVV